MVDISSGVFLIGLLSVLSLAGADEFSDGTADYLVADWVEARTLEDTMREESIVYNHEFKVEIFAIKGEDAQCLYKVLRVSFAKLPIIAMGQFPFKFAHLLKASCSVSLDTLSTLVRCYELNGVEYKLEGNKCRLYYPPITDHYKDCKWKELPHIPKSAELEPYQHKRDMYMIPHSPFNSNIMWDGMFTFSVGARCRNQDWVCDRSELSVSYRRGTGPDAFTEIKKLWCSCGVDALSLHRFIKKDGRDTLVYQLKDGTCLRSTAKYHSENRKITLAEDTVNCDEFFKPITTTVPIE